MARKAERSLLSRTLLMLMAIAAIMLNSPAMAADEEGTSGSGELVIGGRDVTVDADGGRDAKFDRNTDTPSGLVLDYFQWSQQTAETWWQVKAWDVTQRDERFRLRAGIGDKIRIRASYQSSPYRYGDGARFVLGNGPNDSFGTSYRIADFIQSGLEDPDGNGTPFYNDPNLSPADNSLVQGLTNDLFTGTERFSLGSRRRSGAVGITIQATKNWRFEADVSHETRRGNQSLGSGTYQRITDVDGDGNADYDYYFSVRGVELPAEIDYRTTRFEASANYQRANWFVNLATTGSFFDNEYRAVTYDNPFWLTDTDAGDPNVGSAGRGLWEMGRASLEPSNEAYDVTLSGGVNLPARTRITASISIGEHSQDDSFLPITTNTATIGTADINLDTVQDAQDDPTRAPGDIQGMPSSIGGVPTLGDNLDASSDTTAINFTVTSRPVRNLTLTGRYRSYQYEGQEGIQVVPARTEYIESRVKLDFKGDMILHVPLDFTRETLAVEGAWRFSPKFKIKAFAKRKSYEWDRYQDTDGNSSRDSGTRAVSQTDDDIFGLTGMFGAGNWLTGRVTVQQADREFDGDYMQAFSGENPIIRQWDIANRERDAADFQLDFMVSDTFSIGVGGSLASDEYPDSKLGLQEGDTTGVNLSLNYTSANGVSVFGFADWSGWDADMHLRTKCANCTGFTSWTVPNYDWFVDYEDTALALGAGVSFDAGQNMRVDIMANYMDSVIEQTTENPDTPTNLDPNNPTRFGSVTNVAMGYDFPDQENTLFTTEVKVSRSFSKRLTGAVSFIYEDFSMDDFQWDNMDPYGPESLVVDDATRFMFLDSRYQDYTAGILQVMLYYGI